VIAGDCNMTVAVAAGLGPGGRTGVVWLDAHGDLNTPETDASGHLDGQGLAMLAGRCWAAHTASRRNSPRSPDYCVLLAGALDLDEPERALLSRSPG
jgi:arginase